MEFPKDVKRTARSVGGKNEAGTEVKFEVQVPQPFTAGPTTLTEGMANALNQTIAENLSNNLRAKVVEGKPAVKDGETVTEPGRSWTAEEVQGLVDAYLADYEIGVRRTGTGEARVTDPVEREARKIAKEKAVALIKSQSGKPADYDLGPIVDRIFEANKEVLMKEGTRIVRAMEAARKAASGDGALDLGGIELSKKPAPEPAAS